MNNYIDPIGVKITGTLAFKNDAISIIKVMGMNYINILTLIKSSTSIA